MSRVLGFILFLTFIITCFLPLCTVFAYDDQGTVQITGAVGVTASDVELEITSSASTQVPADSEITYTITYGSNSLASFPITLVATWEQGQIEGSISPTVELLSYKEGSATQAYGSTTPVIDVVDRKITWTIPSFPAQTTNQTVQFILKTSSDYRGSKNVTADVTALLTTPSGVPDKSVSLIYKYIDETPTNSTATPTPSPTAVVSALPPPSWEAIELVQLSDSNATFRLTTTTDVQVTGYLGTKTTNLKEHVITATRAHLQPLTFADLISDTTYYVQFKAVGINGLATTSSIYTFTTTRQANPNMIVDRDSIVVSQSWGVLFNQSMLEDSTELPHFSVSQDTMLDFLFRIPLARELKEATLLLRDPYVLGISTDVESDYSSSTTRLVEVNPGTFVGKIKTPLLSRTYEIAIRTEDVYGNIQEQTVGQTTVVQPFKVEDVQGHPLWGAQVLLWSFQEKTAQYELAPFNALSFQNPIVTTKNGNAEFSLIPGRYKARISMTGYETKEVEFELTAPQVSNLPTIVLNPVRFGLFGRFLTGIELARQNVRLTIGALPQANPTGSLYDVLLPFNLLFFTILSIAIVLHLQVIRFPLRTLLSKFTRKGSQYFEVNLEDLETNEPLSHAIVYLVDEQKHQVVARGKTGLTGGTRFLVSALPSVVTFFVKRHGYVLTSHPSFKKSEIQASTTIPLTLERLPATTVQSLLVQEFRSMTSEFIGFGSEAFLTLSLLCTLLFTITLSPARTIAFGMLTLVNLSLWLIVARHSYGLTSQKK